MKTTKTDWRILIQSSKSIYFWPNWWAKTHEHSLQKQVKENSTTHNRKSQNTNQHWIEWRQDRFESVLCSIFYLNPRGWYCFSAEKKYFCKYWINHETFWLKQDGEKSVRQKFHTAKFPYGKISLRRKFLTEKIPYGEKSYGENYYGENSYNENSSHVLNLTLLMIHCTPFTIIYIVTFTRVKFSWDLKKYKFSAIYFYGMQFLFYLANNLN